jgi:hypothetical protein
VQFSSDGRLVYFVTPAWATSGAVHVVDTTDRKERFVVAGNDLRVVHSGEYRDHLLLAQHRYFLGGGSYDWFYLFTPPGRKSAWLGKTSATSSQRTTRKPPTDRRRLRPSLAHRFSDKPQRPATLSA